MNVDGAARSVGRREVWLRGNPRPLVAVAAVVVGCVVAITLMAEARGERWMSVASVAVGTVVLALVVALAFAAALPRIERRGSVLRLRLAPTRCYDVPLDVVECFFQGSHVIGRPVQPCTGEVEEHEHDEPDRGRRRGTIAVRIAERAEEWQERPTFRPWAGWKRGSIVLDGLWFERLPMERFGELAGRLVAANRSAGSETGRDGAVFLGAMTYIGNGPNFMVKAIAEKSGVKMPSFFGYMAYSCGVLLPIFLAVSLLFL